MSENIVNVVGMSRIRSGIGKKSNMPFRVVELHCISVDSEQSSDFEGTRVAVVPCFFDVGHVKVGGMYELVREMPLGEIRPKLVAVRPVSDK